MIFKNRSHAGIELSKIILKYKNFSNTIILGLPRGGIVVAYEVAKELQLPMDLISLRKIGAPTHKELAIGAVDEEGIGFFNTTLIERLHVPQSYIELETKKEQNLALARSSLYRKNRDPLLLSQKNVILIDDGLATGATMKAAVQSVKRRGASKTMIAVPLAPPDTLKELKQQVDEIFCLYSPSHFSAVGQFYEEFEPTSDQEVIELMKKNNLAL